MHRSYNTVQPMFCTGFFFVFVLTHYTECSHQNRCVYLAPHAIIFKRYILKCVFAAQPCNRIKAVNAKSFHVMEAKTNNLCKTNKVWELLRHNSDTLPVSRKIFPLDDVFYILLSTTPTERSRSFLKQEKCCWNKVVYRKCKGWTHKQRYCHIQSVSYKTFCSLML